MITIVREVVRSSRTASIAHSILQVSSIGTHIHANTIEAELGGRAVRLGIALSIDGSEASGALETELFAQTGSAVSRTRITGSGVAVGVESSSTVLNADTIKSESRDFTSVGVGR